VNIGHQKFNTDQISEKEAALVNIFDWEIASAPTVYEIFELLMMAVRRRLHEKILCFDTESFIAETHTLGLQILRAYQCSQDSIKKPNMEVTPSAIQIALAYMSISNMAASSRGTTSAVAPSSSSSQTRDPVYR
jgi:hypothetical protein